MLLLTNSLIICQTINTNPLSKEQIDEVYKGLKQAEYLKVRLKKAEVALNNANNLIESLDEEIRLFKEALKAKDDIMLSTVEEHVQELNKKEIEYSRLNDTFESFKIKAKQQKERNLKRGIVIGVTTTLLAGVLIL